MAAAPDSAPLTPETLRAQLQQAQACLAEGQVLDARTVLSTALAPVAELSPEGSQESLRDAVAEGLTRLGHVQRSLGEDEVATRAFSRAAEWWRAPLRRGEVLRVAAVIGIERGTPREALEAARQARAALEQATGGEAALLLARALATESEAARLVGELEASDAVCRQALELVSGAVPEGADSEEWDEARGWAWRAQGWLFYDRGQVEEAVNAAQKAQQAFADGDEATGVALALLLEGAALIDIKADAQAALTPLQGAGAQFLEEAEDDPALDPAPGQVEAPEPEPDLAEACALMGRALARAGQAEQALGVLEDGERALGPVDERSPPRLQTLLGQLALDRALALTIAGQLPQALEAGGQALGLFEARLAGGAGVDVEAALAQTLARQGSILLSNKELDEAQLVLSRAVEIYARLVGLGRRLHLLDQARATLALAQVSLLSNNLERAQQGALDVVQLATAAGSGPGSAALEAHAKQLLQALANAGG